MTVYYADDLVTLYHGDCLTFTEWADADILVTDPPYGRAWRQGALERKGYDKHDGIANDHDSGARDAALALWGEKPGIVFGDLMIAPPEGTKQVLVYLKPSNAGIRGAMGGYRRDIEAIYLVGKWGSGIGGDSSIIKTSMTVQGSPYSAAGRFSHPHAKPGDVMERLIEKCPDGVVADPFAGSGSTLVAARNLGHKAIGVELDEAYCEVAARRLSQGTLL